MGLQSAILDALPLSLMVIYSMGHGKGVTRKMVRLQELMLVETGQLVHKSSVVSMRRRRRRDRA